MLLAVVAVTAVGALIALVVSLGRLSRSVDEALVRIGDRPAERWVQRPAALRRAVTRLERARSVAEQERVRLAGALQRAPIGVLVTDGAGVVVFGNDAAATFLGARRGEAVAEVRIREVIARAGAEGMPVGTEVRLYTPTRRVLHLEAIPLDAGAERAGAVVYISDVTEQRRVEEMRRDFVANVGHELKTPLGALAVLAETLAGEIGDPDVTRRLAGRVEVESRRLSTLVGDILDLSRAEAARTVTEPVAIADVAAAAAETFAKAAAERGVDLEVAPVPADAVVPGDPRQLRSLLGNLIDNAIKYSDVRNGRAAPVVAVRVAVVGDEVVLDVADQGIGIPEGHLSRVFERFYRVDQARSRATGGTGLGLSIVRNVAVGHGGGVSVRSEVGVGSTFTVRLPRWRET